MAAPTILLLGASSSLRVAGVVVVNLEEARGKAFALFCNPLDCCVMEFWLGIDVSPISSQITISKGEYQIVDLELLVCCE